MARFKGDTAGLFWDAGDKPKRRSTVARVLPPTPDTGWQLPGPERFPDLRGEKGALALDTETKDLKLTTHGPGFARRDPDTFIAGISLGSESGFRQYYPIAHENGPNLDRDMVLAYVRQQLSNPAQPKIGANIRYDVEALQGSNVEIAGPLWDVQYAEPLINENRLSYNLESLSQRYLEVGKETGALYEWLESAFGADNIKANIWRAPSAVAGPYAEGDVDRPLRIFAKQRPILEAMGSWEVFDMESRLIPMMNAMRFRGVRVDLDKAERLHKLLGEQLQEALAKIKHATGIEPDIWAADSLAQIFDSLGVPYLRTEASARKPNGSPSFRKAWLQNNPHPVAKMIVQARTLDKFRGTFIEGYILNGHVNGRIHCTFNQLRGDDEGTISGRFSSAQPNLQNIPTREKMALSLDEGEHAEKLGKIVRSMFIPEDGQQWWKYDWSQVEYRLIAHYAATQRLPGAQDVVDRYNNDPNVDYHQSIADLTGLDRGSAKNLNFGLAYGQGLALLCFNLGVDMEEGKRIINEYHRRAPFIRALMDQCSARVAKTGEIFTLMHRVRHFDQWEKSVRDPKTGQRKLLISNKQEDDSWQRAYLHKALNALIQGSAADVMKKAMVMCWEAGCFAPDALGAPHLTVHDELDGSIDQGNPRAREALAEVKHIMETCVALKVPLVADGSVGENWGALK